MGHNPALSFFYFLKDFSYLFLERVEGREKREKNIDVQGKHWLAASHAPNQRPGPQPRHVPWVGINLRPFGVQYESQPTEPHQPGQYCYCFIAQIVSALAMRVFKLAPESFQHALLIFECHEMWFVCYFPCPSLGSTISTRSSVSFYWRIVFRNLDMDLKASASRARKHMYVFYCIHTHICVSISRPFVY